MSKVIGVDLGASYLRVGIVDEKGHVLQFKKERTTTPENLIKFLNSILQPKIAIAIDGCIGIGIGAPGPLDLARGVILNTPNLVSFRNTQIIKLLKREFNMPVYLERDTNVALLGEAWMGAARNLKNVVMLTLGTGVGGAILADGKLYHGEHGVGAEIGHSLIDVAGPICSCGQRGHLEAYLGLAAVKRDYGIDHWTLIEKVKRGERKAIGIATKLGEILGIGLAAIINIFDPQIIILAGGLMDLGKGFAKAATQIAKVRVLAKPAKTKIELGTLGDYAGVIGAARLVFRELAFSV